jgi:uncharacterized membrane protein YedE/YeeE
MNFVFSLLSGLIFGFGLILSGMTQPGKVIGFLDFTGGAWQWDLAGVMGGALITHAILRIFVLKRAEPLLGGSFPSFKNSLDGRLITGAAFFGLGWGTAGFCPGPALVSAASGAQQALIFVAAMFVGMFAVRFFEPKNA